ncbi:MAG: aspartyl/glutamyl-tRNA amidotransferase subunit A [Candidatus Jacksonbacteria bacterium RIFCSPLOWO2_02_FULL_43_9]|nr:MAG: Glutamyl-tRNA(Gln) amidotransferase subunit A [Parcubacteria group bacterium GW2011_GWA2_43_13]OGY69267.1 MAG: aspartyl/glutamyl-tRNA amidotransferase subunit A [Candidatus Jacksonbacteria bacterium RIFCSPHIGHO2_02_FULL_43_10]OGY71612.1 MAG: aspartyl/glutamyl-tRNA amidotransferase subunit A [Candidatus Jacksonbacteria bacterium RIFCSPLOWO2_01_FULL_44_13]OGY74355.1 MAG: aspartyl/glutamyl-tRNA amidotransferase subunit A [Candidatus Jacksonbacteria bacterium RIFCSPLOWO2_02_FULL_43_9]HAZ166
MKLNELTIKQAQEGLRKKEFSAVELAQACLDRIAELNDTLNVFLTVTAHEALEQAQKVDESIATGEDIAPLAGIPMSIKDIVVTKGIRTTAASKILENYIPPYSATVYQKLIDDGAVMLGKVNLDEFAHGASTENSAFGPTKNPWDTSRVPGGSSGGSAASVSADMCLFSIGTDTGGSIRFPAGFCSVVGVKPSYGRCSRLGLIAMTSSTDVPGPIAKTVEDSAIVLSRIAGCDHRDATTVDREVPDYEKELSRDMKGMKIGIVEEFLSDGIEQDVKHIIEQAIDQLSKMGAEIISLSLPTVPYAMAVYYVITPSEISSNLARFDGIRFGTSRHDQAKDLLDGYKRTRGEGFGAEAKRRIMMGTYALSSGYYDAYYRKAQKVRTKIVQEFQHAFSQVSAVVTPVSPHIPFKIGEKATDPVAMYLEDIYMSPPSLAGLPALSVPAGFIEKDGKQLPVGLQIIGPQFEEARILRVAHQYQMATPWHLQKPSLMTS